MLLSKNLKIDNRVLLEKKSLEENDVNVKVIYTNKRYKNTFIFLFYKVIWLFFVLKKANMFYKKNIYKFDVVHCHDLDTLIVGCLLKRFFKIKLVYDAHEIFGYMIENKFIKMFIRFVFIYEEILVEFVDIVITVTPPCVEYFRSICNKPIALVMNCKNSYAPIYLKPRNDVFTICYIGGVSIKKMFPGLVYCLSKIKDIKFIIGCRFENIGMYNVLKEYSFKHENIVFLGEIESDKVLDVVVKSNVVVSFLDPSNIYSRIALPSKVFDAIACGRPVIVNNDSYCGDFVNHHNIGVVIDYEDYSGLETSISFLRDNPQILESYGFNAFNISNVFSWDNQQKVLLNLYKKLGDIG